MKKLKLYLDTSVISHLKQDDVPDKMADTLQLWEEIKAGLYDVVISDVTLEEIGRCSEPKYSYLIDMLNMIQYSEITETEESLQLARDYLLYGILTQKSFDDCRHISIATMSECDIITSWNFKHFVNIKTITKVQAINKLFGYKEINILPPTMLLESEG